LATVQELRFRPTGDLQQGDMIKTSGNLVFNDGIGADWVWDPNSQAVDDGVSVITPINTPTGRWLKAILSQGIVENQLGDSTSLAPSQAAVKVAVTYSSRSLNDRASDTVHAKDFGAKFDGVTDDTAAIQAAINLVSSRGGGTVILQSGSSKVTTLNRPDSVMIRGAGRRGTRLVSPTGYNAPMIQSIGTLANSINRGGVQDLALVGSGKANAGMVGIKEVFTNRSTHRDIDIFGMYEGMYVENVWQVLWDNIHVHGGGTDQSRTGFRFGPKDPTSGVSNAVIANGCVAQGVEYCGWRLENYDGAKFTSCEGMDGNYGWYLGSPSSGSQACQFGHFVNCLGDTNSVNNWRIDKGNASDIRQAQFANCWGGSAGQENLYVGGASQLVFSNWQLVNAGSHGISLQLSSRMSISGCHIRDYSSTAGRNGICVNNSQVITMTGNQIYTSKANSGVGIMEYGSSNYNAVVGNALLGGVNIIGANSIAASNVSS